MKAASLKAILCCSVDKTKMTAITHREIHSNENAEISIRPHSSSAFDALNIH